MENKACLKPPTRIQSQALAAIPAIPPQGKCLESDLMFFSSRLIRSTPTFKKKNRCPLRFQSIAGICKKPAK
jgi:hypothetical protein